MTNTVSHIDVHIDGLPTQPLLGTSTKLSCSVTLHPQLKNHSILTIQYLWSSNGSQRGNGQELVLPDLSPADATMYSCNVMVSSNVSVLLIKQINVASTYNLTTRSKFRSHY